QNGPDMDFIAQLIASDETIKGIWCVPKYANPNGVTYSNEVVQRFANLKPLATDFLIFWDNAYCIHSLEEESSSLLNIFDECVKNNTQDSIYLFTSTSKVSFAGSGIACIGASKNNIEWIQEYRKIQTLGADKINQLRHAHFFKNKETMIAHMKKHAHILKPKFDCVQSILHEAFAQDNEVSWSKPRGGYFISVDLPKNCAKKTVERCKELGIIFTPAGSTFPYANDP
ncbi:MAG: aminotransferase, partial [Oscillospiraceae bacterium]